MLARLALVASLIACSPAAGTQRDADDDAVGPAAATEDLVAVELATVGVDAREGSPVVLLREPGSGKIVPIWVGVAEAHAILRTMLGIEVPRPMTHDLLADVVRQLGATVAEVLVHEVRETTYIGRIRLRVAEREEPIDIDSRPSDALALAIRTDAPIRVAPALLTDPPEFDFLAPEADEQVVRILGMTVVVPSTTLRDRFQLPDRPGLVVVGASGDAAREGIRRGDLVLEVNGMPPAEPMDFLNAVLSTRDLVRIRVWREDGEHEFELAPTGVPSPRPGPDPRRPAPIQT
jgi:uncharacterized protein